MSNIFRIPSIFRSTLDHYLRRPNPKGDIFLFTEPRSGMTWLMEMFNTLPYTRCVQEPMTSSRIPLMQLYFSPARRYVDLADEELRGIVLYLRDIQQNKALRLGYNFFRGRKFRTNLNVIALARVCNLISELQVQLPCRPLILVRHPIPNSISRLRNRWHLIPRFGETGWVQFIDVFLNSESFTAENLSDAAVSKCWKIRNEGSDLERFVASWCLDLIPITRAISRNNWLLVTYEDLITQPGFVVDQISKHFGLMGTRRMLTRLFTPSQSTKKMSDPTTIQKIRSSDKRQALLSRWRNYVSEEEEERLFEILRVFGIRWYQPSSDMPTHETLQYRLARSAKS